MIEVVAFVMLGNLFVAFVKLDLFKTSTDVNLVRKLVCGFCIIKTGFSVVFSLIEKICRYWL